MDLQKMQNEAHLELNEKLKKFGVYVHMDTQHADYTIFMARKGREWPNKAEFNRALPCARIQCLTAPELAALLFEEIRTALENVELK